MVLRARKEISEGFSVSKCSIVKGKASTKKALPPFQRGTRKPELISALEWHFSHLPTESLTHTSRKLLNTCYFQSYAGYRNSVMRQKKRQKTKSRCIPQIILFFPFKQMLLEQNNRTRCMSVHLVPLATFFPLLTHLKPCYSEQRKQLQGGSTEVSIRQKFSPLTSSS